MRMRSWPAGKAQGLDERADGTRALLVRGPRQARQSFQLLDLAKDSLTPLEPGDVLTVEEK